MSSKNRAARRRAERAHGGAPLEWEDYKRTVQIGVAVLVVVVLVGAVALVRSRQATSSAIDAYCQVYNETHGQIVAAKDAATSTTTAPPATTPPGSTPGTTPGSTPGTAVPIDPTASMKAAIELRRVVGPQNVQDAWGKIANALTSTKLTTQQQSEIQTARDTVNNFAKDECGQDPADF